MNIMRIEVRPQRCYVCVRCSTQCSDDCDVYVAREAEARRLREHPELRPKPPSEYWDW